MARMPGGGGLSFILLPPQNETGLIKRSIQWVPEGCFVDDKLAGAESDQVLLQLQPL
jgi:hypothetical protein